MKNKKVLIILIVFLLIASVTAFALWSTPQAIDFSAELPEKLSFCDTEFDQNNAHYKEIKLWLQQNQDGWKNNAVNYVTNDVIFGDGINLNILQMGVVVNYQTELGNWKQVVREKASDELVFSCK